MIVLNNSLYSNSEIFSLIIGNEILYLKSFSEYFKENKEKVIKFFQTMDKMFYDYLGITVDGTEETALKEINEALIGELDNSHKHYVIETIEKEIIGYFYLYDYKEHYKRCNISIGLIDKYRGKGYTKEIVKIICDEMFKQGIIRIGAEIETTNISSLRCMSKLGFKKEGILRNQYGENINCIVFSMIKEDWINKKK